MDQRPDRISKPLQAHCQERYSARNVPGESSQRRGFPDVHLDELPEQEMGGQFDLHCRVPGRDLVEIARKLARRASSVLPLLAGPEGLSVLCRQGEPVNDPKGEVGRLVLPDIDETGGVTHSSTRAWSDWGPSSTVAWVTLTTAHSSAGPCVRYSYMVWEIA